MSNLCKHNPKTHHRSVHGRLIHCDVCKRNLLLQDGKYFILLDNDDDEDVESDSNDFADVATGIALIGGLLGGLLGDSDNSESKDDDDSNDDFGGGSSGGGGSSDEW